MRDIRAAVDAVRARSRKATRDPLEKAARTAAQAAVRKKGARNARATAVRAQGEWIVRIEVPVEAVELIAR